MKGLGESYRNPVRVLIACLPVCGNWFGGAGVTITAGVILAGACRGARFAVALGRADAHMGIGLDVFGNFSSSTYEGTGCTNPAYIVIGGTVPGQVLIRGPGNGLVGYCAINSTATTGGAPRRGTHGRVARTCSATIRGRAA